MEVVFFQEVGYRILHRELFILPSEISQAYIKTREERMQQSSIGHCRVWDLRLATFGGMGFAWFRHPENHGTQLTYLVI